MDFDSTFTFNNKDINYEDKIILDNYLKKNEMIIITEDKYSDIYNYLEKNNIKCDIASLGSDILLFHNKLIINTIPLYITNKLLDKVNNNNIYTAYFEYEDSVEIINYQERLEVLYPKLNRSYVERPTKDAISIFIAININIKDEFIKLINELNLKYVSYGSDKNRIILKITNSFSTKLDVYNYLKSYLCDKKTIGISDSINDMPLLELCDIKFAMKNGDNLIKEKYQNTKYDVYSFGAIKELKNFC